ncbi:hypothetical protein VCSRO31_2783 [Vibrio cholerae]|nr:hypothetical protein [Vibrio cholerae]GHZ54572.1 hypothetical protein VCSRO31_2783 [Vibrio cholerae]
MWVLWGLNGGVLANELTDCSCSIDVQFFDTLPPLGLAPNSVIQHAFCHGV